MNGRLPDCPLLGLAGDKKKNLIRYVAFDQQVTGHINIVNGDVIVLGFYYEHNINVNLLKLFTLLQVLSQVSIR